MSVPRASEGPAPAASTGTARPPAVRQAVALPVGTGVPSGALTPTGAQRRPAPAAIVPPEAAPAAPAEARSEAESEAGSTAPAAATAALAGASAPIGGRTTPEEPATTTGEPSATAGATAGSAAAADGPTRAIATATATTPGGPGTGNDIDGAHAGRPKKPLLAAAAIVGSLLIALPFLLTLDGDRKDAAAGLVTSATAGTVLQDDPPGRPGVFTAESPSASPKSSPSASPKSSPSAGSVGKKPQTAPEPKTTEAPTVPAPVKKKPSASPKAASGTGTKKVAAGTKPKPVGRALVSAQSGKCLSAGSGKDGTQLTLWTCDGSASQRWDFRSDGTVRALNMCMDVAWGSTENLTDIQVAHCSGNPAQQFHLNSTQDLVARSANKCVDIYMGETANGTPAVLFPCSGDPNQTWT